jgi:hypothetical protein
MTERICVTPDTLHNTLGKETVVMNLLSGESFSLDAVAHRIWELVLEHGERDRVVDELMDQFEAPAEEIGAEVDSFLSKLTAKGLLEACS